MRGFSLLVKPASWSCNLRCGYCFYLRKSSFYAPGALRMPDNVLKIMTKKFMAAEMPAHSIAWQGGEPTLMGLDFFKAAVKYQRKFARGGEFAANAFQTNGTLLDDEWCRFFAENKFLIGISIDGPAEIHDINRLHVSGHGSHADVMRGLESLKRNGVEHNVLTLVNSSNENKPLVVYNYLKELGLKFHQYIECVEFMENGDLSPFSVSPHGWGTFLCRIFDEWFKNDTDKISVRLFDSILVKMLDGYANVCAMNENCCQYFVVEHNGDVYPCDFFVQPEWKLGNVKNDAWHTMLDSEKFIKFGKNKTFFNEKCSACKWRNFCVGCCPKNRSYEGKSPESLSALCEGWKIFYEYTYERFCILKEKVSQMRKTVIDCNMYRGQQ